MTSFAKIVVTQGRSARLAVRSYRPQQQGSTVLIAAWLETGSK